MRTRTFLYVALLALTSAAFAQTSPPNQSSNAVPINTTQITMPLLEVNMIPATGAALAIVGNPGPRTDYYWISANYLVGNASLAGPFVITTAPNTRSSSNYVTINPTFSGAGLLDYDVLRTSTPIAPTGACACAVATDVAIGTITNDESGTLNSYTVNPYNTALLNLTLQNEVQSAGVSHLILRQNGVLVCDLSTACGGGGGGGITGSGTASFFPIFTGTTAIGNSVLTNVSSPAGINYSLGSGLSWQIDASHLTWNSGIGGSITIANTYVPSSGNNAGGLIFNAANALGSACAGTVILNGGSTNGAGNGSTIQVGGGCSNGFGAIGADVLIQASSTSASNSGGSILLEPGTGGFGNGIIQGTAPLQITDTTTSRLPACGSGQDGTMRPVTDASVATWGTTFSGGGSNKVLAYCNGVSWTVAAALGSGSSVGSLTTTGQSGPATLISGVLNVPTYSAYAPQRVTSTSSGQPTFPVTLSANTQTTILTVTMTFPSAAGTYRADIRYGLWSQVGANEIAAFVYDSNNQPFAFSESSGNGAGFMGLTASEISSVTYAAGATVTFTLVAICNDATPGFPFQVTDSNGLFSLSPNPVTFLAVRPVSSS